MFFSMSNKTDIGSLSCKKFAIQLHESKCKFWIFEKKLAIQNLILLKITIQNLSNKEIIVVKVLKSSLNVKK